MISLIHHFCCQITPYDLGQSEDGPKGSYHRKKFSFGGKFKTIYSLLGVVGSVTLPEVDYVEEIQHFMVNNFKVVKAWDPWMYDPLNLFINTLHRNKKSLSFKHELCLHIECYSNQNDKEVEQTLEWDLVPLKRDSLGISRVNNHHS